MSRATELLEQAPPLPWGDPDDICYGEFGWYIPGSPLGETDDTEPGRAAMSLATYAVNRLPDYEAAVEALERLLVAVEHEGDTHGVLPQTIPVMGEARAALARLRDKVPADV